MRLLSLNLKFVGMRIEFVWVGVVLWIVSMKMGVKNRIV